MNIHQPNNPSTSYKSYFSKSLLQTSTSPANGKQNQPTLGNKKKYQFYFSKSTPSEKNHQKPIPKSDRIKYDQNMQINIRQSVYQLISYIETKLLSFECFLSSVTIFYEYISKREIQKNQLTTYVLASLFISSKLFEVKQMDVSQLVKLTDNQIEKRQIFSAEENVIEILNFDVFLQTPFQKYVYKISQIHSENDKQTIRMLIELCLLNGDEITREESIITCIQNLVSNQDPHADMQTLKSHLKPIFMTQQYRSFIFKWSLKLDTDSLIQKLQY